MAHVKTLPLWLTISVLAVLISACTKHEVEVKPVEIKPIHITIDVNVRVERALEDFFSDLDDLQTE